MNLFVLHWAPRGRADGIRLDATLRGFLEELPLLEISEASSWSAPSGRLSVAWVTHSTQQTCGVRYVHIDADQFALFAGRPFRRTGDFDAEGASTLDARTYLDSPDTWAPTLEGRAAVIRYDERSEALDVVTDALGIYHLYGIRAGDEMWIGNNVELLRRILGRSSSRLETLTCFFACGWSFGGQPRWEGVDRLPAGAWLRYHPGTGGWPSPTHEPTLARADLLRGNFAPKDAARLLVAATGALAEWPGRPKVLMLTSGRDSRLIFAAALRAGIDVQGRTIASSTSPRYPETVEVQIARRLCEARGLRHDVIRPPEGVEVGETARLHRLVTPGTVTLRGAARSLFGNPPERRREPLDLVYTGLGGEFSRLFYGEAKQLDATGVVERLYSRTMFAWPRSIVSREAAEVYRSLISDYVTTRVELGIAPKDLLELFYIEERMGNWAAGSTAVAEYTSDLLSPLWSRPLLAQQYGLSEDERARQLFHPQVMQELDADLLEIPFGGQMPWTRGESRRQPPVRIAALSERISREIRRRVASRISASRESDLHPFPTLLRETRTAVAAQPHHQAWEVLDRRRTERLLATEPRRLDPRSRDFVWRLASVFIADAYP